MVDEVRASQLDLAARATFAADGERVTETRAVLSQIANPQEAEQAELEQRATKSAEQLAAAARSGWVEVG
jgi:hypothetical protein